MCPSALGIAGHVWEGKIKIDVEVELNVLFMLDS
jgi:hypothetical protein